MKRAIALGFFDGVHIGHGALFNKTKQIAQERGLFPCVMTYSSHPSEILSPKRVPLINTTSERASLISELYGISDIVIKDFTIEYASLSCEDFFDKILISELSCEHVIAGYDFRFGKNGSGDVSTLRELCRKNNMGCEIVDVVECDGEAVNSSRIRKLIEAGDMETSSRLLGHHHCTISPVVHGQALGASIGFATANQHFDKAIGLPKRGVYASRVTIDGKTYKSITNIGVRPTVCEESEVVAETHIPSFSENLYGKLMKTEFVKFIREERAFPSLDALYEQISQDLLFLMQEN